MKRLILIFVSIFSIVFASQANTFTVTSNADNGAGTLRQALNDIANLNTGVGGHIIIFNAGMTITLNNSLDIYNDTDFNGLTVNGFVDATAGPDVIIRSNNLCGVRGFNISFAATNLKFYGLVFQNLEYGIYYGANSTATALNSQIKGCYFGTDITGATIVNGICKSGINLEQASSVTIGGTATTLANGAASASNNAERCIFGGTCNGNTNEVHGAIRTSLGANNSIVNNYIGVSADGNTRLVIGDLVNRWANVKHGIVVDNSKNNTIDGNVISGAVGCGIYVVNFADNTTIKGNKIGTNAAGTLGYNVTAPTSSFGNEACGIYLNRVSNCIIGGSNVSDRNLIAANGGARHVWGSGQSTDDCNNKAWDFTNQMGIYAESSSNNTILGNYIGTDVTGMLSGEGTNNIMYNRAGGIKVIAGNSGSSGNIIGGTGTNDRNVISGHREFWGAKSSQVPGCTAYDLSSFLRGGTGIILQNPATTGNTILGNYIGLAADGVTGLGNLISGIELQGAASNTIGGAATGARNYFCDNGWGIMVQEDFQTAHNKSTNNTILGNWIGLNKNGAAVGNGVNASSNLNGEGGAIALQMGSSGNKIGTAVAGGGNVISGNRSGIVIRNAEQNATGPANTNTIYNNIIGLDPTGATAIPNTSTTGGYGYGIQIEIGTSGTAIPFANIIGGTAANQPNIISGNQKSGIYINSATTVTASTANSIVGNYIGTNLAGTADRGNTLQGIEIINVSKTTITSNLISGNDQNGISLTGSSTNTIQNNIIGSNATKTAAIPNSSNGISVTAGSASNIIGGIAANEPNFIFNNGANGVLVDGATSISNSIHQNSFSCNTLRGIVLSNGGNSNIKTATILGSVAQLTYTNPNAFATRIEIFETDGCATCPTDPTRLQGKTFVISGNLTAGGTFAFTNALGFSSTKLYTAILHQGTNITTTAARNTSEFTACYVLCSDPTPSITGTTTLCEGTTGAVFTISPINTGSTYSWTVPTNVTVTAGTGTSSITVTIGAAPITGSVSVTETVTGGCVGSGSAALTIKAKPTSVSAGTTQNLCSATSVSLTGSTLPSGTTGLWTVTPSGPTFGNSGNASTTASGLTAGTNYTFTWSVTNAPCAAVSNTVTINNPIKPTPSITGTTTLCEGTTGATFTTTSVSGNSYSWTVPTNVTITSGAATSSITTTIGAAPITGNVTVTESSSASCSTTANAALTIKAKPTNVSAGADQNLCSATSASLTGSTLPSGATGAWSVLPSGPTFTAATSASTTANGLVAGTNYTFTWSVTNAPCAAVTSTVAINNPIKPTPSITGITTLCEGTTGATFTTTSVSGNSYSWTVPTNVTITSGAATSSITTTIGAAPITGNVTVTESSSASCSTTANAALTIKAKPTAVSAGADQNLCSATSVSLTGSTLPSGTTGLWTVSPSGPTFGNSGNASTTASGLTAGTNYTFTWSVTNAPCAAVSANSTVNNPIKPTPSILGTTILCEGTPSTTFNTVAVSGNTYSWTVPTGVTITAGGTTAAITTSIGAAPITGDVTVTESSSASCSTTVNAALTIKAKPTNVSAGADQTLCAATTVSLTGSTLSGGSTGLWTASPSTGITFADATSPSTNANGLDAATSYTFTWSVTNAPCAPVASTVAIANKPQPTTANAGANQQTCNTGDVTLAGNTATIGTGAWSVIPTTGITFDDASSPTAKATGLTAGTVYTFTWTISNAPCSPSAATVDVSRTNVSSPSIDGGGAYCSSVTSTLSVNPANAGSTYVWDVISGDATITSSNTTNPITVSSGSNGGVIRVRETNGGCTNIENTTSITISPNNTPAAVGADYSTCLGETTLVGSTAVFGTGTWSVVLPSDAVLTPSSTEPGVAVASNLVDGETYTFVYTVSGACGPDQTDQIVVTAGLTGLTVDANGPSDTLCYKTNRYLSARAVGGSGNYSYVWVSSDKSFSGKVNASNIVVQPTHKEVTYTVYAIDNLNIGCKTDKDSVKVHAFESQDLYLPNLITPNNDELNDRFILRDKVTHQDMLKEGSHLEVVNRWGSKVYEADNYDNSWVPKDLTDGMYYYHITNQCGNKEYKSWLQILGNKNN